MDSIRTIPLDLIDVPDDRLRQLDPDAADMLALSINERGLMHPITVWAPKKGERFRLIAGLHRLSAVQRLGWSGIAASVFDGRAIDARLLEIDENVFARRLSPLDQAAHLAERKRIYEELYPETRHGGDRKSQALDIKPENQVENFATRFSADAAEKIGVSERLIRLAIARHTKIAPDVRAQIALTWIANKGAELDALAKLEPAAQRRAVMLLLNGEAKSVRQVSAAAGQRAPTLSAEDMEFDQLRAAWRRAGARARARWIAELRESGALDAPRREVA